MNWKQLSHAQSKESVNILKSKNHFHSELLIETYCNWSTNKNLIDHKIFIKNSQFFSAMLCIPSCLTVDVVPIVIYAAFFHLQSCACAINPFTRQKLEDAMSIRVKFGSNILEPLTNFSHASCLSRLMKEMSTSSDHIWATGRTVK